MYKGAIIERDLKLGKRRGNNIYSSEVGGTQKVHARKPHLLHLAKLSGERTCKCVEIEGGGNKSKGDQKDNP